LDSAGFRYALLNTPLALPVGTNYVVGAFLLAGSGDFQATTFQNLTTAPGISYNTGRFINNTPATLTFPTSSFAGGIPGGSFEIGTPAVPEPTTWVLLLVAGGAGALALARRRLSKS
jgi:hypothetical protein